MAVRDKWNVGLEREVWKIIGFFYIGREKG